MGGLNGFYWFAQQHEKCAVVGVDHAVVYPI
jgi:hypothetical protein